MNKYYHSEIEKKWKNLWRENNLYEAVDFSSKPKKYILAEFPYPSGKSLHAGHMMRFTVPDIYSRYLRMKGFNVLFPFGYDAFGLPAETYAIKTGNHPSKIIDTIINDYRDSVMRMGYGVDWSREIKTTDPDYYKWTQWIFLKFFKEGLAKYKEMPIWWCEGLKTVLSDEEVINDKDGNKISERGEFPVERKLLKQWVLEITKYADKLLEGLNEVDFPESIKSAQTNWIGKSTGAYIDFPSDYGNIRVFTTRPDTLFGVTFLALSPEHPSVSAMLNKCTNRTQVKNYIDELKKQSDLEKLTEKDKTGICLKGICASHPLSSEISNIPVYVTNYVLSDYGTGAVMGVPAHDKRDYDFADKYALPIRYVIGQLEGRGHDVDEDTVSGSIPEINNLFNQPYEGNGQLINSGDFNGMDNETAKDLIAGTLQEKGLGEPGVIYKLRDWIFSRQRYWGEPIPLIHYEDGTIESLCDPDNPEEVKNELPLTLPELPEYNPSGDGSSPLERNKEWISAVSKSGRPVKRESNTMPNWAGSCWYFMRYADPKNSEIFADYDKLKYWLPVDRYFGGAEHTTMHLLYSRFWHRFLFDLGLVPTKEPYAWRINGGLLLGPDGKKMSKSIGNIIEPLDLMEKYGADALRLCIAFLGPYEDTYPWNESGLKATSKLVNTLYGLSEKLTENKPSEELLTAYSIMVKKVSQMIEDLKMNTAVSEFMIFINILKNEDKINTDMFKGLTLCLSPFAPFVCEELWQKVNKNVSWENSKSVHFQSWPDYDDRNIVIKEVRIPVQINGKVRDTILVSESDSEQDIRNKALSSERVKVYTEGKDIKNYLYKKGRIVSISF